MNIMHLRYAIAIEETGSVTRAAERLFVAQPNISRAIRDLEISVGMALFQRTPLGMVPTEEGKSFLRRARHIVQEIDSLKSVYENGSEVHRYFSACSHGGRYVATAFADFAARRGSEAFSYNFTETGSAAVISGVSQGLYGLGIIRFAPENESHLRHQLTAHELIMEPLFTAPLMYTVSARSHLAVKTSVSPSDTKGLTEITGEATWVPESARRSAGRRIRLYDRESRILALQTAGDAYVLGIKEDGEFLKSNGLVQRASSQKPILVQDAVIFRKKYVRTKQDKVFLEALEEKARIYI